MSTHVTKKSRFSLLAALLVACLMAGFAPARVYAQQERPARPLAADLEQKAIRRMIAGSVYAAHPFGFRPFVRPAITDDNWVGGASGTWSTPGSWSLGTVPASGNNANITSSGSTVTFNQGATINNLSVGATDVLSFNNNTLLTIAGTTITNSNSTGSGGLQFNSSNNGTGIEISSAAVSLTGGGTITMSANTNNLIFGAAGGDVLTNVNNTIQGAGKIGDGIMGLNNQGTIDANQASASLTIQTSSGTTNSGTLEATAGGNLILSSDTFTNTSGTILASGANSVVTLTNATINGGKLNGTAGGQIQLSNGSVVLNGVTNLGTTVLPNNTLATIEGTITNSGSIQFNSSNNSTGFASSGAVTLTGGGSITMSDNNNNFLYFAAGGASLNNVNNTISGSGNIGDGDLAFTNSASGVVDAVSSHGNTLLINPGTPGATNLGLMEASSGGLLEFEGVTTNTNGTVNGTIEALTGGEVLLSGATISGGTLTTAGTGVIVAQGSSELNGATNTVTNAGNLQIPNNNSLLFTGTIDNTGTIQSLSSNNATGLEVASTTATLSGSGSITFSDNNNNYIYSQTGGNQLTLSQPVSGPGGNIGDGSTVITNQSTIDATASAHGNTLTIQPDVTFTNNSLLEATGGGSLALDGGTFNNASGTITAGSGSTVTLEGSTTVAGGTLNGAGLFVSNAGTTLDGSAHTVNLSNTTFEIPNNTTTLFKGTLNNTGTIEIESSNNTTALELNSATGTLQGTGGTITFSDNNNNYIYAATGGNQLTIAQPVSGAGGNIGDGDTVIINQSTIDATASAHGNTLTIQPDATFTNNSLLEATGGGSLALDSGTFTNTHGTITAGSGSTVTVEGSATITGGTLNGAGTFVLNTGSTLNALTTAGLVQVPNNTTSFLEGTITNTGAIQVNSGNNTTILAPTGSVTLTGGGALTFSDNNNNYIENGGSGSFTNVNNTISGSGNIGDGVTAITNQAAGVIDATSSHNNTLTFDSPSGVNAGLMEASSGGTLLVEGTLNNSGGTVEGLAGTGSNAGGSVVINGATITSGTLNTLGSGVNSSSMTAEGGATLVSVTNNGTIGIPNNTNARLQGTVTNNGTIDVNSSNNQTVLYINGSTTLNGSGVISLTNNSNNFIFGVAGTEVLTNNGNTIEGSGNIGDGTLGIINNAGGTILANQPTTLIIQPNSSGITNNGTLQVNTGSLMNIVGTNALTNFNSTTNTLTGGTYNINGGELEFVGANIVNNAADIILTGASAEIVNSSNSANALASFAVNQAGGTFQLGAGHSFTTAGNFTNNGLLIVGSGDTFKVTGSLTNFSGSTLTGGSYFDAGTLQFGASGTGITTNDANITLSTAGWSMINLGGGNLLTNLASNGSGSSFTVANNASFTTAGAFSNAGTIDLENGGTLKVSGALTNNGTVSTNGNNQGGAANSLTVTGLLTNNSTDTVAIGKNNDTTDVANVAALSNSGTVTVGAGATLNTTANASNTNGGSVTVDGGTFDVEAGSLNNTSTMDLEQKGTVTVAGNLTNSGTITTNNSNLGGGANTLTVGGTLTNSSAGVITVGVNNNTSDVASINILTNSGSVTVDKGASLKLTGSGTDTNTGTITVKNGTLSLATAADLDMENGGSLAITGAFTNAGSLTTNEANQGGNANTITVSGKVTNSSGSTIAIGANNDTADTASFGTLANTGSLTVGTGATLSLTGTTTNTDPGTMTIDGTLNSKASITLSGTGTMTLSGGTVAATGTSDTLTVGAHNTVSGSGTVSGFGVTNAGTLSANQASPLIFLPSSAGLTNSGTIKVSAGDTMEIGTSAGGALKNLSGTTLTGGIYSLTGTLEFGASGTTIATNAANITLTGTGEMKDFGGNNILAGFNNNASTGVFKLATGAALTTNGGNFTNAGNFTISTGTTFTIGGSGFNYTQTAGSTTVAGTLTSTSLGTVDLNGGTLTGAGTIGDNLVDDSTLDPGTSAAKTGKLTVADTYTQDAGGTLNIQINGAAAGTKYDQLKVTGAATLGGVLNINLGSFTPTVGQTFTILTASSVADQFTTVNGLGINGSEHFTISYNAGTVVLTVVSGPLPASSSSLVTNAVHPVFYRGATIHHPALTGGHYALAVNNLRTARTPVAGTVAASLPSTLAPALRLAHVPAASPVLAPVTLPVGRMPVGLGRHGFHAMDDFGTPVAASSAAGDSAGALGSMGISAVGAEAYNSMSSMNHMRFEVGIDMKALMKTSRKQLVRSLWASPDSPEALSIGYMTFTSSH